MLQSIPIIKEIVISKDLILDSVQLQIGNRQAYEALKEGGEEGLKDYIYSKMWNPEYRPLVYLPPGKGE